MDDCPQRADDELDSSMLADSMRLTEGQHRTLCVSRNLPDCMRRPDGVWCVDQFELLDELYRGKTSLLHEAVDKASGTRVAIKQYKKKQLTPLNRYQVEREVAIHIGLDHPHIVALHAAFEDPEQVYLVQEFAPGGDLFEALKHQAAMVYGEQEAVGAFMAPCLEALAYLHDRGIIHRDLKPENILLGSAGCLKLADFGLAINTHQERPVTRAGTLDYMAPEVLVCPDKKRPDENKDKASLSYNQQVDAWAAGCLAAELVTGSPPFEAESRSTTYQLIMYREPRLPQRLSEAAKRFVSASLVKTPQERATVYQLLQHEWISTNREAHARRQATAAEALSAAPAAAAQAVQQPVTATAAPAVATSLSGNNDNSSSRPGSNGSSSSVVRAITHDGPATAAGESTSDAAAAGPAASNIGGNAAAQAIACASSCSKQSIAANEGGSSSSSTGLAGAAPTLAANADSSSHTNSAAAIEEAADAAQQAAAGPSSVPQSLAHYKPVAVAGAPARQSDAAVAVAAPGAAVTFLSVTGDAAEEARQHPSPSPEAAAAAGASGGAAKLRHRDSSNHGHRLHKLFYPHDKHRRSSYSNMQWDDWIDTSARSFSGSTGALPPDSAGPGDAAVAAAGSSGMLLRGSMAGSCTCGSPRILSQGVAVGFSRPSAAAAALEGCDAGRIGSFSGSSGSSSGACVQLQQCAGIYAPLTSHQAVLAALPDAEMHAPAAVLSDVLAKAASGAVHLLAANDLEDLIAPTVTPSSALCTLGLVAQPSTILLLPCTNNSFASTSNSGGSNSNSATSSRHSHGPASQASDQRQRAGGDVDDVLAGGSLEDYIATSAAPGGRMSGMSLSFITSRNSSASSLSVLAATPASPPASPTPGGLGSSSSILKDLNSSSSLINSPRASRVRVQGAHGATPLSVTPGAAGDGGAASTLPPRPPLTPRSGGGKSSPASPNPIDALPTPASPIGLGAAGMPRQPSTYYAPPAGVLSSDVGLDAAAAAAQAYMMQHSTAPAARPMLHVTSGTSLHLLAGSDGSSTGVEGSLQHASASLPVHIDMGEDSGGTAAGMPSCGSKKVVWADETPLSPGGAAAAAPVPQAAGALAAAVAASLYGCTSGSCNSSSSTPNHDPNSSCVSPGLVGFDTQDSHLARTANQPTVIVHLGVQMQHLPRQLQSSSPSPASPTGLGAAGLQRQPANYYAPPAGVLSSDVGLSPRPAFARGPLASKAAAAFVAAAPRSVSCVPADLRAAAAGTMGQQQLTHAVAEPQSSGCRGSNIGYVSGSITAAAVSTLCYGISAAAGSVGVDAVGRRISGGAGRRRSSGGSVSSAVFEAAVPFDTAGAILGLARQGATSKSFTSMGSLAAAAGGAGGMSRGPDGDADGDILDLIATRHAKSFTAGLSPLAAAAGAGSSKRGALTPTKVSQACGSGEQKPDMMAWIRSKSMTGTATQAWL